MSFEEFEILLERKIKELSQAKDSFTSDILNIKERTEKAIEKADAIKGYINLYKKDEKRLMNDDKYIHVIKWFNENLSNEVINKSVLLEKENALLETIGQYSNKLQETEGVVSSFSKELMSLDKETVSKEKIELDKSIIGLEDILSKYQFFVKDNIDIDVSNTTQQQLMDLLEKKYDACNEELGKIKILREEYQKLESYSDNIWPFLQSENAKYRLMEMKKELVNIENDVEPLIRRERDSTKNFLDTKIKEFFHEDLINKLYKKIDPHPDFKSVEFKANFDSDAPRLDVFVRNIKDENTLIPNLYFSTAQINILSLSIFLATALNSKEYKCIFIDDPIQSMDSVNILSTIDLLRSIVVNEDKQIILSTHDKNFHNLLAKKMPSNLFESKFLELESFGKVRVTAS